MQPDGACLFVNCASIDIEVFINMRHVLKTHHQVTESIDGNSIALL